MWPKLEWLALCAGGSEWFAVVCNYEVRTRGVYRSVQLRKLIWSRVVYRSVELRKKMVKNGLPQCAAKKFNLVKSGLP